MITNPTQTNFDDLHQINHQLELQIKRFDDIRYDYADIFLAHEANREQLKKQIISIQSVQVSIDKIILLFKQNDEIVKANVELMELRAQMNEKEEMFTSFSDQLLATHNELLAKQSSEHASSYEEIRRKDAEIVKLIAIINDTEIPFLRLEKQAAQNDYLKADNEAMRNNISNMNALLHVKSLEIEKKASRISFLEGTYDKLNEKLRLKNEQIEKLIAENKKLKENPMSSMFK